MVGIAFVAISGACAIAMRSGDDRQAEIDRRCSTGELLAYLTGWALLAACFTVDHDNELASVIALAGLCALPGPLIMGPLGFLLGGRRLFVPASLFGASIWIVLVLVPAMYSAR